jgi:Tfp pilus assembly protein PilO
MNSLFPKDRRFLRLTTASVGAALWGALLLGYYGFVYCPLRDHQSSQRVRIEELQTLLRNNANVHTAHRELRGTVTELEEQIAAVRRRIPNEPLEATFLSDATSVAEQEQLQIENFRRLAIDTFPDYSEVDVVINGRGSYASICRFMHRVSQLDRLSTVRRLTIESNNTTAPHYPFEVVYSLQFGMQSAIAPKKEAKL